jgi:glycosyltransferase involved in cell wall biosynthesis
VIATKISVPMKILFVLTQSLDSPSGLGRYGPLAREIARRGYDVELIALHYAWHQLAQKSFIDSDVRVNYVGQMHVRKEGPRKLYYGPVRLMLVSLASTFRLTRALLRSEADIIQLCKPQPYNVLAARLGGRGRPIYCDCDDYEAETNRFAGKWQRQIVRYFEDGIVRDAAGLTVNTHFTRQRYIDLGYPEQKIVYVPNGVERERFDIQPQRSHLEQQLSGLDNFDSDAPLILYVGTLGLLSHPVDLLLEAFQQIAKKMPRVQLMLIGGGEDFDILVEQSRELGIDTKTFFMGRQPPEDIPAYLSLATVSVDPVHDDLIARARSPLKALESMAMGVPVVTGDVGDRRQILEDGAAGVLVKPGDSQALADGIELVLKDPQGRQRMVDEASSNRERWYWDNLAADFLRVYGL